jgi:hypothetical protein
MTSTDVSRYDRAFGMPMERHFNIITVIRSGETNSTHGKNEKYIQDFGLKT